MTTAAIQLTLLEASSLLIGALILGSAIYFFLRSRRTLEQTLKATTRAANARQGKSASVSQSDQFTKEPVTRRQAEPPAKEEGFAPLRRASAVPVADEGMVQEMKATIAQQQKLLNSYLKQVEVLENEGKEELRKENESLQREISKLHGVLESKDLEIEELEQEANAAKKMADKIEEVYQEFDHLQSKMALLEKQANRANSLAMELDDARNSYEQVHRELVRKSEKMEELMNENQRMRFEMNTLEDKLSEANLQRQQLQKKVQFLSDLNTDMQSVSDTNKKLQTELRRIGELESMLNMMAEERDFLLKKKER